jgi:hypothetical protein
MKKVYLYLTALTIGAQLQAQTIDFESSLTDPETYDNGSEGNGDFQLDPIGLSNYYSVDFNYFSGFAISNVTDNTTPGYMNQYSAYPGFGADNSNTYCVATSSPKIYTSSANAAIVSLDVSNTTYAGISMRDGDGFAKQFGSFNNAAGEPDSTNGEDFFKVWFICESFDLENKDSIEFFLADFRFTDSTEDYILDTWETIDLTSLSFEVGHVSMRFESSDNGDFGMNTPGYIAIDNIKWQGNFGLAAASNERFEAYPNPVQNILTVNGLQGRLEVHTANGREIFNQEHNEISNIDFSDLPSGLYLVKISTVQGSITRRIVK